MTLSTAPLSGSRFLDPVDDVDGSEDYYTPRHLRAVPLSPDLQRALDEAFAPEEAPRPARLALVEPEAVPTDPEPAAADVVEESVPARALVGEAATVSVPEPPVIDPVASGTALPVAAEAESTPGRPPLALVIPETILFDPMMVTLVDAEPRVAPPILAPEPAQAEPAQAEPAQAEPAEVAPEVSGVRPASAEATLEAGTVAGPTAAPVVAAAPAGPSGFPDPAAYAARRFDGGPASAPSVPGSPFRRKVDPSRLLVPEPQGRRSS